MSELIDVKKCPYCAEEIRSQAVKCRYCGSRVDGGGGMLSARSWYRTRRGRRFTGVCAGLAEELDVSVTLIRLAFIVATIIGGWGLVVYVALWVLMPMRPLEDDLAPSRLIPPGDDLDLDLRR